MINTNNKILIACFVAVLSSISLAETATATANQATASVKNLQSHDVEDLVVLGKIAKQNEAVNETVLNNEAVRETLNEFQQDNRNQSTAQSANHTPKNLPQSTAQGVEAEKLALKNPVIDEAKILTAGQKSTLEQKVRHIYEQGLAQPAVVIVSTTEGVDIFSYAMQVAERWQLGTKNSDNGLLIVVAVNDRKIQILTGYGLEGVIPDAIAKRIIREDITPFFKQGDYAGGINAGLNRMEERLLADPEVLKQADENQKFQHSVEEISPVPFAIIGLFVGMFLTSLLGRLVGAGVTAGGVLVVGLLVGFGFFTSLIIAILLFVFLLIRNTGGGGRGGSVYIPTGGGFGGGGFGGGGYSGGGGGFGGGGAGGSW